ncbi:hypothetical protein SAMN00790413_06712 [Deinococcus hopiensis KR-140]|uniref:Uncharacterized protein n=1 Tax=Deinococcus hopiensis KR-140 TaxID=695939 RepID=A0A1W1UC03_9DEIO|nr:hypothetical protein SAMN00790413_06712 [Deinococcus hopiensis KR-140]
MRVDLIRAALIATPHVMHLSTAAGDNRYINSCGNLSLSQNFQ